MDLLTARAQLIVRELLPTGGDLTEALINRDTSIWDVVEEHLNDVSSAELGIIAESIQDISINRKASGLDILRILATHALVNRVKELCKEPAATG
ncbi:hypothetical protein IID24_05925 [Patescibacteria group bacterium]|nr:hypothetical protein [Patescibacteria group bacterium]